MTSKKTFFFIGTTAELLRIAPIINDLKKKNVDFKLITSGQTKIQFNDLAGYLNISAADIAFKDKLNKSSLLHFAFWAIRTFFTGLIILRKEFRGLNKTNSYFVICGDPVSTSIGAAIAKIYGLKIIHIESGDMSGNILEPFPEEICRNINIRLADVLFPPGVWAKKNLRHIHKKKINTYHNTMVESFWWFMNKKVGVRKDLHRKKYYVLILHRQEHILFGKTWSKETLEAVIKNANPELTCVLFNHPLTMDIIKSMKLRQKNIKIIPPVSYAQFLSLMKNSEFIATDGATNQLEVYLMGKPCLILRNHTEQIEGLKENVVLYQSEIKRLKKFLLHYKKYRRKSVKMQLKPSKVIVDYLINN